MRSALEGRVVPAETFLGFVRLCRPANLFTAQADILAGCAVAGVTGARTLTLLLVSTTCLYAGGVVLNDVCDARVDAVERPERPIPSGVVPVEMAAVWSAALLVCGVAAGWACSATAGVVALAVAAAVVLYDTFTKRWAIAGSLNMGLCRGLNLLLGLTAAPALIESRWSVALVSLAYIAGITALSRGEVSRAGQWTFVLAAVALMAALGALAHVFFLNHFQVAWGGVFSAILLARLAGPMTRAWRTLEPRDVRFAVGRGVMSLIVLDAALAAGFAGPLAGALILSLLLPAMTLAKFFAVT